MREADDVERLEKVLEDAAVDGTTRRSLLKYAAASAAAASAIAPARALAQGSAAGESSTRDILNAAVTAEALAVTYLTGLVQSADKLPTVKKFKKVLQAANQAEYDHYQSLTGLGVKPMAMKFWAPDAAFQDDNVFPLLETFETLFVNAYLLASTQLAKADEVSPARYAGEICGVEAQHRTLVRYAQGKLPNNVAFEAYTHKALDGIVNAITDTGVGLGKRGQGPGQFYKFPGKPPAETTVSLHNDTPE
jgi:hypothetical protein